MHLLDFKCSLFENIAKFMANSQDNSSNKIANALAQTLEGLKQEINTTNDRLYRYRLHHILKNKANKKRKESMLASSLSAHHNEELSDLEKSIVLIEKDLGIETENDEN